MDDEMEEENIDDDDDDKVQIHCIYSELIEQMYMYILKVVPKIVSKGKIVLITDILIGLVWEFLESWHTNKKMQNIFDRNNCTWIEKFDINNSYYAFIMYINRKL